MNRAVGILLITFLTFSGCSYVYTAHGAYYHVQKGDTLADVAKKCRVDLQELAEANDIDSTQELKVGQSIYIPGVTPSGFTHIIEKARREGPHHKWTYA